MALRFISPLFFLFVWSAADVQAVPLDMGDTGVEGSLDTTISFGLGIRTSDRDAKHIATINGGTAHSANTDDGNLNYDQWDIFSLNNRITQELDLRKDNIGLFVRSSYLYDWAVMDMSTQRTPLSGEAKERLGMDLRLLDAYMTADFAPANRPLTVRAGNLVVNWGESTFIQNGINTINPIDVSKLRVAGAELREAFLPVPTIHAQLSLTPRFSFEGFYQLFFKATEIEPVGSFFSTSDVAGPGADSVMLGFGGAPDVDPFPGTFVRRGYQFDETGSPTKLDKRPSDGGQFGIAVRYFEPLLNDTEFGFYYTRLHSRLPIISAQTAPAGSFTDQVSFIANSSYYREYPDNIHTLGTSFNTQLNFADIALQGEFLYRKNQPLQIDDVEILYGAFSVLNPAFQESQAVDSPASPGDAIAGYRRKDILHAQATATKLFGPVLGMSSLVFLGEVGMTQILGMEKKEDLRYEAPGTYTSGNPIFEDDAFGASKQPSTQRSGFPTAFSAGYRLFMAGRIDNAIGAVSLMPSLAFNHDVKGTTPAPITNFIEGRMALTAAVAASYLEVYRAELAYTNFFGAEEFNLMNDRDFLALSFSMSF